MVEYTTLKSEERFASYDSWDARRRARYELQVQQANAQCDLRAFAQLGPAHPNRFTQFRPLEAKNRNTNNAYDG